MMVDMLSLYVTVAAQETAEELDLLWLYIGIAVVIAVILLAALVATPSSRRREHFPDVP